MKQIFAIAIIVLISFYSIRDLRSLLAATQDRCLVLDVDYGCYHIQPAEKERAEERYSSS